MPRVILLADGTAGDLLARLPDHTAVCIVLPIAAATQAAAYFRDHPSVAAVFESPGAEGHAKLRLTPKSSGILIDEIAAAVRTQNFPAIEIYQDGGNLDDAFRLITTGGVTHAAA